MKFEIRTDVWGVPKLVRRAIGYVTVAEAVRVYIRFRREDIQGALLNIRYERETLPFSANKIRRFRNMNLYMNRLQGCYRKIRMANKILEEYNGANRS